MGNEISYPLKPLPQACSLPTEISYPLKPLPRACTLSTEISYPLKPFLVDTDGPGQRGESSSCRERFWSRCVRLIDENSSRMLRMNKDPRYFTDVFRDLKSYSAYSH